MIKELLYNHFGEKKVRSYDTNKINFAPSYLKACKRQIFYKKTGVSPSNPITEASLIKMSMGDAVHEKIQTVLMDMGIYEKGEEFEEIIWNDLVWIYRVDGVLNVNDTRYVLEIKSIYNTGFKQIEKNAKQDHELQLLMYLIFENIDRGMILYIGRDNGFMVEYDYFVESLKEKYKDFMSYKLVELKELKTKIELDIIPDRDYQIAMKNNNGLITEKFQKDNNQYKTDWQCSYCQYKDLCWEKEREEMKQNRFFYDGKFIK